MNSIMLRRSFTQPSFRQLLTRRHYSIAHDVKANVILSANIIEDVLPYVKIAYENGTDKKFAAIHLRDCCRCSQCFDTENTQQRLSNITHSYPISIKPSAISIENSNELQIIWPDGHRSYFTNERLEELIKPRSRAKKIHFDHSFVPEKFKYDDFINDKKAMKECFVYLKKWGVCLLDEVPEKQGQMDRIGDAVAHLKETNYGRKFVVKSKPNPSNLAYTSGTLALHTDLPFYRNTPGIQMLHCIKAATQGGENTFSDGFRISEHLRINRSDSFDCLSKAIWDFFDIGTEYGRRFHLRNRDSIIGLDSCGDYLHFKFNERARGDLAGESFSEMYRKYQALHDLTETIEKREFKIKLLVESGQCVIFDNLRVLHGREGYRDNQGQRLLEGAYLDWDEVNSFIRVA